MTEEQRQHLAMQLSAYLDDELEPDLRGEIESLLDRDAEARALLEELRNTIEAVQNLPRARASGRLMESLRGQLERQALLGTHSAVSPARTHPLRPGRWLTAAAVIGLAATAAYLAWPMARDYWRAPVHYAMNDRHPEEGSKRDADQERESGGLAGGGRREPAGPEELELRARGGAVPPPTDAAPPEPAEGRGGETGAAGFMALQGTDPPPPGPAAPIAADVGQTPPLAALPDEQAQERDNLGERPSTGATVVEVAFADAARRRDVAVQLRTRYDFRTAAEPSLTDAAGRQALLLKLPSREAAQEVIAGLQESLGTADTMQVLAEGEAPIQGPPVALRGGPPEPTAAANRAIGRSRYFQPGSDAARRAGSEAELSFGANKPAAAAGTEPPAPLTTTQQESARDDRRTPPATAARERLTPAHEAPLRRSPSTEPSQPQHDPHASSPPPVTDAPRRDMPVPNRGTRSRRGLDPAAATQPRDRGVEMGLQVGEQTEKALGGGGRFGGFDLGTTPAPASGRDAPSHTAFRPGGAAAVSSRPSASRPSPSQPASEHILLIYLYVGGSATQPAGVQTAPE